MADPISPRSCSTIPAPVTSPAGDRRWTSLHSVSVTPPGCSPRVVLRPLSPDRLVKVTEAERRRRAAAVERVRDTVPRLLVEFADRLEAVFSRGTVLLHLDWAAAAEDELQDVGASADRITDNKYSADGEDGCKLKDLRSSVPEESTASIPSQALAATEHCPQDVTQTPSPAPGVSPAPGAQQGSSSGGADTRRDVSPTEVQPGSGMEPSHAAAAGAAASEGVCSRTAGAETPPLRRRFLPERQVLWADSVPAAATTRPPEQRQTSLPPDKELLSGGRAETEPRASHRPSHVLCDVFTTPRNSQPDLEFKRPLLPLGPARRSAGSGRRQRGGAAQVRSRRSEAQRLTEEGSRQCDAFRTPHRREAELKPVRVSDRWHQRSDRKSGRPRPELRPSPITDHRRLSGSPLEKPQRNQPTSSHAPANSTPPTVPESPHRPHSELQPPAVTDRGRAGITATPRRYQLQFKPAPPPGRAAPAGGSDACDLWGSPAGGPAVQLTPRGRRPPSLSPGGSGDRLRRVKRWLESSVLAADPAEKSGGRRRHRTPSLTGTSATSSRRRRPRIEYTEEEVSNLVRGVQHYGRDFKAIRLAYEFHPSRTTVDLYDKWRHMPQNRQGAGDPGSTDGGPGPSTGER